MLGYAEEDWHISSMLRHLRLGVGQQVLGHEHHERTLGRAACHIREGAHQSAARYDAARAWYDEVGSRHAPRARASCTSELLERKAWRSSGMLCYAMLCSAILCYVMMCSPGTAAAGSPWSCPSQLPRSEGTCSAMRAVRPLLARGAGQPAARRGHRRVRARQAAAQRRAAKQRAGSALAGRTRRR